MATASKGFRRRVQDRQVAKRTVLHFFIETFDEDAEGNEIVIRRDDFHASTPTQEQLMAFFAEAGREDSTLGDEMGAVFGLLKASLPADEYRVLYNRFKDPDDPDVDIEWLQEVFEWLVEQWQDFSITSPSGSPKSQGDTGQKSTGRVRGAGSTR